LHGGVATHLRWWATWHWICCKFFGQYNNEWKFENWPTCVEVM